MLAGVNISESVIKVVKCNKRKQLTRLNQKGIGGGVGFPVYPTRGQRTPRSTAGTRSSTPHCVERGNLVRLLETGRFTAR